MVNLELFFMEQGYLSCSPLLIVAVGIAVESGFFSGILLGVGMEGNDTDVSDSIEKWGKGDTEVKILLALRPWLSVSTFLFCFPSFLMDLELLIDQWTF